MTADMWLELQKADPGFSFSADNPCVKPGGLCWVTHPNCMRPAENVFKQDHGSQFYGYCSVCYSLPVSTKVCITHVGPYPYVLKDEWDE